MKTYPEKEVRKKVKAFVDAQPSAAAAAMKAGCTPSEMSIALNGGRLPAKLLKAIKLQKKEVYTDV